MMVTIVLAVGGAVLVVVGLVLLAAIGYAKIVNRQMHGGEETWL